MADLAHDASGPASSEPADIAVQQAGRPASSDRGKLRVFISYSRDDLDFADQLTAALDFSGFECFIDREGISGGEEWKRSLGGLISEADTVVFVLTPNSARSPICDWEVEEATRLNKRILPIVCRPLEAVSPPPRLRDLNYIFFYKEPKVPGSGFGTGLAKLVTALNTDFDWLRDHTRYLQRAIEWDKGGRPANRLLSGDDIAEAKAWVARRPKGAPEPTALQLDFIRASEQEAAARLSEQRKQLEAVAAAQAARETALHDREEALKQAADAQRKAADALRRRARIRNIALVIVSALALIAGWLGWSAEKQRKLAEQQRITAEEQRTLVERQRKRAEEQSGIASRQAGTVMMAQTEQAIQAVGHKIQVDAILARAATIFARVQDSMDSETKREAFELLQAGAKTGSANWADVGVAYEKGLGVRPDNVKAREWYERAAASGSAKGMTNLGMLYANGLGVVRDYRKAREWFEKAAAQGDAGAKMALERLPIREAETAGRYAEALRLEEALAAKLEAEGMKRASEQMAPELNQVVWYALFARDFTKALTAANRAHALVPGDLAFEPNRAHALMFLGHNEDAKALYLAHKGEPIPEHDNELWEQAVAEDFTKFRKAGLTHPMMADIEKELGISR